MKNMMTSQWWVLLLRGLITLIFGVIALTNVKFTVLVIFVWFVFYAIADGIFNAYMSWMHRHDTDKWWLGFASGVLGILLGIIAFIWPQLTALLLLLFIAIRATIEGITLVVTAIQLRKEVKGEWLLIVGGLAAIIFGIWMFLNPVMGGLAALWLIGIYAVVLGIILIIQSIRMKMLRA